MADEGIVYVLSNEAMPGLVKIGLTQRSELEVRLNELYSTGVPLPFTCEYACRVKDCKAVENALHIAFTKDRINPAREFFRTSVEYVKPILELLKIEDITTDVEKDMNTGINSTEIEALNNYKKRRPQLNFEEMGIPVCTLEHSDLVFDTALGTPSAMTRAVELYLNHIMLALDFYTRKK